MSDNVVAAQEMPEEDYQPSNKQVTRWQYTRREMKKKWVGYAMVGPFFLMFATFTIIPVVVTFFLSFTMK